LIQRRLGHQPDQFAPGNLDAAYAAAIGELFRSFNQVGVTVVIATHDASFAVRMKPRLVVLKEGRVAGAA